MTNTLQTFAEAFFVHFGAEVYPKTETQPELLVILPPELQAHFGRERLYLVFPTAGGDSRPLSAQEDLLVYGSRVLDTMLALLKDEGQTSYLPLAARYPLDPDSLAEADFLPAGHRLRLSVTAQAEVRLTVINYRAILQADERQERILSLVLDATGHHRPEFEPLLRENLPLRPPAERPAPPQTEPDFDFAALYEQFQRAEQIAQRHAETLSADLASGSEARLKRAVQRLTAYYHALQAEVSEDDPARKADLLAELAADLERKIHDELTRYQLYIQLIPLSYALIDMPYLTANLHVDGSAVGQFLRLRQNQVSGAVERLTCAHCQHSFLDEAGLTAVEACAADCVWRPRSLRWALLASLGQALAEPPALAEAGWAESCRWAQVDTPTARLFIGLPTLRAKHYRLIMQNVVSGEARFFVAGGWGNWLQRWGQAIGRRVG